MKIGSVVNGFAIVMLLVALGSVSVAIWSTRHVRRQGFWDRWRRDLREGLAHLVGLIMRRMRCWRAAGASGAAFGK